MPIRILIVGDHSVVRQGIRMFLGRDPDLQVFGEAQNGAEALGKVREMKPNVVLMDLLKRFMDVITAIRAIRRETHDDGGGSPSIIAVMASDIIFPTDSRARSSVG